MQKVRILLVKVCLLFILTVSVKEVKGQAGFYLYTGPSTGFTSDKDYSAGGANFGYVIGFDVRTNSDPMYFMISAERGANDIIPNSKFSFIGGNDFTYNKFKVGVGFDIKKIGRTSGLRTKVQGNFMSIVSYDDNVLIKDPLSKKGYLELNDGLVGVSTMIGYYKKNLNISLEYEQGFFNLVKDKDDTKLSFINLAIGYRLF